MESTCACGCGRTFEVSPVGRIRVYYSSACRQRAYRSRALPPALTSADRWVRHVHKRPVTIAGSPASSTDHSTWGSYAEARASRLGHGVGFVLGDGFACLDLDHCLERGKPNALARRVLRECAGAYVEVSPSGRGLHVWGCAPESPGRKRAGIEAYSVGRYMTVTGDVFRDGGLVDLSRYFA